MITKKNRVVISKKEFNGDDDISIKLSSKFAKVGAAAAFCASAGVLGVKAIKHLKKNPLKFKSIRIKRSKDISPQD